MKKRRSHRRWQAWHLLVPIALIVLWLQGRTPWRSAARAPVLDRSREEAARWETIDECHFIPSAGNDGDSFHLRCRGQEQVIRLYYADCPETRTGGFYDARLADQARDLGGLTPEQTVAVGHAASAFTRAMLTRGTCRIVTRGEGVYDSDRTYAFVFPAGESEDLATLLIRAGLARLHTKGEPHPDGRSVAVTRRALEVIEREARAAKRGAWDAGAWGPPPPSRR
jgi:endonuclease YncB( thermonuclease family)